MPAVRHVSDVHSYASPHVFSGTQPLSAARAKQLQARFGQAPARRATAIRWEPRIVQYINEEAARDQSQQVPIATGDAPSEGNRAASTEPDPLAPVPPDPTKGDGKLTVEIAE